MQEGGEWYLIHHGGGFLVPVAAGDGALAAAQHIVADGVAAAGVGRRAATGEQGLLHLVNDRSIKGLGCVSPHGPRCSLAWARLGVTAEEEYCTVGWSSGVLAWADLASYCCSPLRRMHVTGGLCSRAQVGRGEACLAVAREELLPW